MGVDTQICILPHMGKQIRTGHAEVPGIVGIVISMWGLFLSCFGLPVGNRLLTMHQRARLLRFLLNEHMRCSVLVVLLETTALEARAVRSRCLLPKHKLERS